MLFRALIVSLGYLWLDFRMLFASKRFKAVFQVIFNSWPMLAIIVKNEKKKKKEILINFYTKISRNLGGNMFKFR